jgi:hypothetical protein
MQGPKPLGGVVPTHALDRIQVAFETTRVRIKFGVERDRYRPPLVLRHGKHADVERLSDLHAMPRLFRGGEPARAHPEFVGIDIATIAALRQALKKQRHLPRQPDCQVGCGPLPVVAKRPLPTSRRR